ncbi:unnamed protein product [Boreogadus saida]
MISATVECPMRNSCARVFTVARETTYRRSPSQRVAASVNCPVLEHRSPSRRKELQAVARPFPCGYTGTMEATTLVLLVLLDCLLVSSSRPFRSSLGGPPMVCNFIKSDVEES